MIDPARLEQLGIEERPDGSYVRHRIRVRNVEYDQSDPKAEQKGLVVAYEEEEVPFPVVLPVATDPDSIAAAQQRAADKQADFYHPRFGWLRWGKKPERDHPENLGAGATRYPTRRVVVADPAPPDEPDAPADAAPRARKGA